MLMENRENQENSWNSKKIVKMHAGRKMATKSLLKIKILVPITSLRWEFKKIYRNV